MSQVWLAEADGHQVALKMITGHLAQNAEAIGRFQREARTTAQIDSPHVVRVLDFGSIGPSAEDGLFMTLEYLRGKTLKDHLTARGALPIGETVWWIAQICRGLTAAHALQLVHRDIKPANILLAVGADNSQLVKIVDFGCAKLPDLLSDETMDPTKTGTLLGTPHYMSPEQAQGISTLDHRTDLWAVGVIAYECLSGQKPFQGTSLGALIRAVMLGRAPKIEDVMDTTPAIEQWMHKALEREVTKRFESAEVMCDALVTAAGL